MAQTHSHKNVSPKTLQLKENVHHHGPVRKAAHEGGARVWRGDPFFGNFFTRFDFGN